MMRDRPPAHLQRRILLHQPYPKARGIAVGIEETEVAHAVRTMLGRVQQIGAHRREFRMHFAHSGRGQRIY